MRGFSVLAMLATSLPFPRRQFLGLGVAIASRADALEHLLTCLARREKTAVAFANLNLLSLAHRHSRAEDLSQNFLIFNDGVGLDLVSKTIYGAGFPENLNGTDFTASLLAAAPPQTRVFLFGARPEVVARAASVLAARYRIRVSGTCHGYIPEEASPELIDRINRAGTDILLVALGNPKQELWILEHGAALEPPLLIAVGAFFDFVAGAVPRAPGWVRTTRLEWLFRLWQEPSRLWRRYTVDALSVSLALLREHRTQSRSPSHRG